MKKGGGKGILLFYGSVGFIVLAIVFMAILDKVKPNNSTDVRAKAAAKSTLEVQATVVSVDSSTNSMTVSNLQFANKGTSDGKVRNLGNWTVTLPQDASSASFSPGSTVTITVIPSSMNATSHTLTAYKITKAK